MLTFKRECGAYHRETHESIVPSPGIENTQSGPYSCEKQNQRNTAFSPGHDSDRVAFIQVPFQRNRLCHSTDSTTGPDY